MLCRVLADGRSPIMPKDAGKGVVLSVTHPRFRQLNLSSRFRRQLRIPLFLSLAALYFYTLRQSQRSCVPTTLIPQCVPRVGDADRLSQNVRGPAIRSFSVVALFFRLHNDDLLLCAQLSCG